MSAKKRQEENEDEVIARNRKAGFEYEILDKFEAGIQLQGSEVKSLRNRDVSIAEAFVRPRQGEMWLMGMNIKGYMFAGAMNHDPIRPRRLLMHRREIIKLTGRIAERGFTIVPLSLYWKHGIAKVQLAVVRGRKHYDKREAIKEREAERSIRRAGGRRR